MSTVFFTGFPGFLGSELLPRVLERSPEYKAVCLIQPKFIALARSRLEDIEKTYPHVRGRIELAEGDITRPNLSPTRRQRAVDLVACVLMDRKPEKLQMPDRSQVSLNLTQGVSVVSRIQNIGYY